MTFCGRHIVGHAIAIRHKGVGKPQQGRPGVGQGVGPRDQGPIHVRSTANLMNGAYPAEHDTVLVSGGALANPSRHGR